MCVCVLSVRHSNTPLEVWVVMKLSLLSLAVMVRERLKNIITILPLYMYSTPLNLILTTDVLARVPVPGLLLYYAWQPHCHMSVYYAWQPHCHMSVVIAEGTNWRSE